MTIVFHVASSPPARGPEYFFGNPFPHFAIHGNSALHAGGFMGSDYAAVDGLQVTEGMDWTRNGRSMTKVGAPTLHGRYATCDRLNGYEVPVTPAGLAAAGSVHVVFLSGHITGTTLTIDSIDGIVFPGMKLTGTGITANTYITDQLTGATAGGVGTYSVNINHAGTGTISITGSGGYSLTLIVLAQISATTTTAGMLLGVYGGVGRCVVGYESGKMASVYGVSSSGYSAMINNDGTRGTGVRQLGAWLTPTHARVFRMANGIDNTPVTTAVPAGGGGAPALISSSSFIRVGCHYTTGFADTHDIYGWALYNRALWRAEQNTLRAALTTRLNGLVTL